MIRMMEKLAKQLANPGEFFNSVRPEDWKPAFAFFLWVTLLISLVTPILNYLGMESTDFSSSYQAQILAYNLVKKSLLNLYGSYAYLIEAILIFAFAIPILLFLTLLLHLIYRFIGGQGSVLNAWKAACYGIGPCLLGGFLPYISLFAGFYSFALQFYLGPRTLYKAKESRAIVVFVAFIALTFIELFVAGTTVGF
ncbi:MAG: YIP1 family protein [Candidatus Bathyarchaeota archaeon]|nr:YIP1 family protein [Candidatus Bathyarchaeota archaeon]